MKRVLRSQRSFLLFLFNVFCFYTASANCSIVYLSGHRWRNNDGSETFATWKAAERTSIVYSDREGILRLRMQAYNSSVEPDGNGGCLLNVPAPASVGIYLQYTTNLADTAAWVTISNASANAFVMAGSASTYVQQGDPTTQQLSEKDFSFYPGIIITDAAMLSYAIPGHSYTEFEWVFKGTPNILAGTRYHFRQTGVFVGRYGYASLTTVSNAPLPVKLTRFSATKEGSKVRLDWTTAGEENSDRFEVLRSADGQSWQKRAQVQSRGNASAPINYFAYDDLPFSGLNQYQLREIDKNGKAFLSEIKAVRLSTDASVLVWPNPTASDINFSLPQAEGKVVVTLQDATGRTVLKQTFTNLPAGAVSRLATPQKPTAGIYILKLETDGFSETRKIIIQ